MNSFYTVFLVTYTFYACIHRSGTEIFKDEGFLFPVFKGYTHVFTICYCLSGTENAVESKNPGGSTLLELTGNK